MSSSKPIRISTNKLSQWGSLGGKKRISMTTPEERIQMGKKGYANGLAKRTPEERKKYALIGVEARIKMHRSERERISRLGAQKRWGTEAVKPLWEIWPNARPKDRREP